jgi:hypothetical protein
MPNCATLAERRAAKTIRQRRWRARRKAYAAIFQVEAGEGVLTMLCRTGWLAKADDDDPGKVAAAISAMLADTAKDM